MNKETKITRVLELSTVIKIFLIIKLKNVGKKQEKIEISSFRNEISKISSERNGELLGTTLNEKFKGEPSDVLLGCLKTPYIMDKTMKEKSTEVFLSVKLLPLPLKYILMLSL